MCNSLIRVGVTSITGHSQVSSLTGPLLAHTYYHTAGEEGIRLLAPKIHDLTACNIVKGRYKYTRHLLALGALPPASAEQKHGLLRQPRQQNHLEAWAVAMECHPDKRFANFIIEGLHAGFRIGFSQARVQLRPARNNLPSARDHAKLISAYLSQERREGRLVGP